MFGALALDCPSARELRLADWPKHTFEANSIVYCGAIKFTCSIWQIAPSNNREFLAIRPRYTARCTTSPSVFHVLARVRP